MSREHGRVEVFPQQRLHPPSREWRTVYGWRAISGSGVVLATSEGHATVLEAQEAAIRLLSGEHVAAADDLVRSVEATKRETDDSAQYSRESLDTRSR